MIHASPSKILRRRRPVIPRPHSRPIMSRSTECIGVPIDSAIRIPPLTHHDIPILSVPLLHSFQIRPLLRAPCGGQQVDEERKHIKRKDESYDPFENGCHILGVADESADREDDGEDDLDDDEGEFEPEGEAEDAVLAKVDPKPLVLCADEDGADDVAGDEEEEEAVVEAGMAEGVEDGEED